MEVFITAFIKEIVFPPGIIFFIIILGILLLNHSPKAARFMLWGGIFCGYILSTSLVAGCLQRSLEVHPALSPTHIQQYNAQAIVILSSERYKDAFEYGGDVVGRNTLNRLRYGAYLHRKTGLPIIVSGGFVHNKEGKSLAQVMADSLFNDFNIDDVILEERSSNTYENAKFSTLILKERDIEPFFLVTSSIHMRRAVNVFELQDIQVIPAPTKLNSADKLQFLDLLPSANALARSRDALHEWLGILWYKLRY